MALKEVALECIQHIRFDEDARSVFDSERVRAQLGLVMDLVIRALGLISRYFSKPYLSTFYACLDRLGYSRLAQNESYRKAKN